MRFHTEPQHKETKPAVIKLLLVSLQTERVILQSFYLCIVTGIQKVKSMDVEKINHCMIFHFFWSFILTRFSSHTLDYLCFIWNKDLSGVFWQPISLMLEWNNLQLRGLGWCAKVEEFHHCSYTRIITGEAQSTGKVKSCSVQRNCPVSWDKLLLFIIYNRLNASLIAVLSRRGDFIEVALFFTFSDALKIT